MSGKKTSRVVKIKTFTRLVDSTIDKSGDQITSILRKRKKRYYLTRLLPEVLRSTLFLGTNAFSFIAFFCMWRQTVGYFAFHHFFLCCHPILALLNCIERVDRKLLRRFTFPSAAFIPSLCASFIAIIVERQHRRTQLAVYMLNVGTETIWRMLAERKIVTPIKNGEVLLFCFVSSIYMYLLKSRDGLKDSTLNAFRFLVGDSEMPRPLLPVNPSASKSSPANNNETASVDRCSNEPDSARSSSPRPRSPRDTRPPYKSSQSPNSILGYLPREVQVLVHQWRAGRRHAQCRHRYSCMASVVESFLRMFGIGYGIQALLKVIPALFKVLRDPRSLLSALGHSDNFKLGAFLGGYVAIFKLVNCVLRWVRNKDSEVHGLIGGFLAGSSMMFWKSTTLAMFAASKLAETLYNKGIEAGVLPYIKYGEVLVYTVSTSIVFHAAVFEPHSLRPAYWKFLLRMTNGRFADMNRQLMEIYGTNASKLMPHFWPDYDPRYSSLTLDSVKEMILQASK